MKTILIPVDFSKASDDAVQYAASLIRGTKVERIILLKSYYVPLYAQLMPSVDYVQLNAENIQEARQDIEEQLKTTGQRLLQKCNASVKIVTVVSELPLLRAIHQVIEAEHPDLLILGSADSTHPNESHIGRQLIAIAKTSPIHILIVPHDVQYQKIEKALVPCDFATLSRLECLKELRNSSHKWLHPELLVLNTNPRQKHIRHEKEHVKTMNEVLEGYQYHIYHSEDRNPIKGILSFAKEHEVQLIIALPGKNSFFYNLTHLNLTEAIALNSRRPVLVLKHQKAIK